MTVVSDPFVFGAVVMLKTFLEHNEYYTDPIVILWNRENAPLSDHLQLMMKNEIRNIVFHEVDNSRYDKIFHFAEDVIGTPTRLRAAFYILEAFDSNYDYVVTLDSDMIVLGDLGFLFERSEPFSVVRAFDHKDARYHPYFNTGTMVIRRDTSDAIGFDAVTAALNVKQIDKSQGKADQAVLNIALRDTPKYWLSERYNFSKRRVPEDTLRADKFLASKDVRILHFLGEKPWNVKVKESEQNYIPLEELWWQQAFKHLARSSLRRLMRSYVRQTTVLQKAVTKRLAKDIYSRKDEREIEKAFNEKIF